MKFLPKSVNGQGLAKSDFLRITFHEHSLIKAQRAFADEAKSVISDTRSCTPLTHSWRAAVSSPEVLVPGHTRGELQ